MMKYQYDRIFASKPIRNAVLLLAIIATLSFSLHTSRGKFATVSQVLLKQSTQEKPAVDWSRYAYTQYATTSDYLCNSIMIFEALQRLNSNASRLLMYSSDFKISDGTSKESRESRLLKKARDKYMVQLKPVEVHAIPGADRELMRSCTIDK